MRQTRGGIFPTMHRVLQQCILGRRRSRFSVVESPWTWDEFHCLFIFQYRFETLKLINTTVNNRHWWVTTRSQQKHRHLTAYRLHYWFWRPSADVRPCPCLYNRPVIRTRWFVCVFEAVTVKTWCSYDCKLHYLFLQVAWLLKLSGKWEPIKGE